MNTHRRANIEGVLETREALRDLVHVQIVDFPQSGMLPREGTFELMAAALRAGADIVGGIDPATIERDPVHHLDAIFGLADRPENRSTFTCMSSVNWAPSASNLSSNVPAPCRYKAR